MIATHCMWFIQTIQTQLHMHVIHATYYTKPILHHHAARSSSVPGAFVLGHHMGLLDQQWSAITLAVYCSGCCPANRVWLHMVAEPCWQPSNMVMLFFTSIYSLSYSTDGWWITPLTIFMRANECLLICSYAVLNYKLVWCGWNNYYADCETVVLCTVM